MTQRAIIWCAVSTREQANEDERYSLPTQESDARALCAREGWQIVDVMRVPGHSRNYKSLDKLAADAARKGINAFYRLIDHLEACDFDVFICRDANRFARRASLLHYIIESIVDDCGARLFSLSDGWVDSQNADIFAMVKGYETRKQIKSIIEGKARGMDKRAQRGLPTAAKLPLYLRYVRDPNTGRAQRVEINEDLRRLWNDLAYLIIERVSWTKMESELYSRFSHVASNGKPYRPFAMFDLVMSPSWWGHEGLNFQGRDGRHNRAIGEWLWDETVDPPQGVTLYRNRHEAVWTGDLASRVKAELSRRRLIVSGKASPQSNRLSGLFVCGECGHNLTYHHKKNNSYVALRCPTRLVRRSEATCSQRRHLSEKKALQHINRLLELYFERGGDSLFAEDGDDGSTARSLDLAMNELTAAELELRTLIRAQGRASLSAHDYYESEINQLSERIDIQKSNVSRLRREQIEAERMSVSQHESLAYIKEITLPVFWSKDYGEINQWLHRAFGNHRLMVKDGNITDVIRVNSYRKKIR